MDIPIRSWEILSHDFALVLRSKWLPLPYGKCNFYVRNRIFDYPLPLPPLPSSHAHWVLSHLQHMSCIVMSFGINQGFGSGLILNGGLVNFALIEKRRGEERRGKNRGKGIKGGKLSKACYHGRKENNQNTFILLPRKSFWVFMLKQGQGEAHLRWVAPNFGWLLQVGCWDHCISEIK